MDDELLKLLKMAIRYFMLKNEPVLRDASEVVELVKVTKKLEKLTREKRARRK